MDLLSALFQWSFIHSINTEDHFIIYTNCVDFSFFFFQTLLSTFHMVTLPDEPQKLDFKNLYIFYLILCFYKPLQGLFRISQILISNYKIKPSRDSPAKHLRTRSRKRMKIPPTKHLFTSSFLFMKAICLLMKKEKV